MVKVITEFDSVRITNAGIQFIDSGVKQAGTKFGCVGSMESETELNEFVKKCEGVEVKKITMPNKITITVSGHIPVKVGRDLFGLSNKDLKPNVYSYGKNSKSKEFTFTADIIDELQDNERKLIAYPNCISATGHKFSIENGTDELAELELEFTVMKDELGSFYYEVFESDIPEDDRENFVKEWHTNFSRELVEQI